jgi:hypothetical protein
MRLTNSCLVVWMRCSRRAHVWAVASRKPTHQHTAAPGQRAGLAGARVSDDWLSDHLISRLLLAFI